LSGPYPFKEMLDGDHVDEVFFVVPFTEGGNLKISPLWLLDLDLLGVSLLM
jgi:hypothetical protein